MKKLLTIGAILGALLCPTSALADKSGLMLTYGNTELDGDLPSYGASESSFSLGTNYTTEDGGIFGIEFVPDSFSLHGYENWADRSIGSDLVSIFVGFEFDVGLRLTGGLTVTNSTLDYFFHSVEESHVGFNGGVGFIIANFLAIEYRIATTEVSGVSGSVSSLNFGVKF